MHVCICLCLHAGPWESMWRLEVRVGYFSAVLYLSFEGLLLNIKIPHFGQNGSLANPWDPSSNPQLGLQVSLGILHGHWGFKLRSSGLSGQHATH